MLITRFCKIVMCLVLAVFCLLVAFDNLTDYETNYLFVRHVLSMDTTFAGNGLMYRSISDPLLWRVAYGLIIAAEAVTGLLFLAGAVRMWQAREASGADFDRAKAYAIAGAFGRIPRLVLRLHGDSRRVVRHVEIANLDGQQAAFRFCMAVLVVLILLNQPDPDLPGDVAARRPARTRRRTDKAEPSS